jgi:hypothetical protein
MPCSAPLPPASSVSKSESVDLRRYRNGEITEAEYLAGCVENATAHLKGCVSNDRLELLKDLITQKLETDPQLIEARARLLGTPNGFRKPSPK